MSISRFSECSRLSAAQAIAVKLGASPHSVLDWMKKDAASAKAGQGSAINYEAENARLRAENLELRRVNELLKEASEVHTAFWTGDLRGLFYEFCE